MQTNRTSEADFGVGRFNDHLRFCQRDFQAADKLENLGFIDFPIAPDHHRKRFAVDIVNQCLDKLIGCFMQKLGDFLDRARVRRFHQFLRQMRFCAVSALIFARRNFQVGSKAALVAQD